MAHITATQLTYCYTPCSFGRFSSQLSFSSTLHLLYMTCLKKLCFCHLGCLVLRCFELRILVYYHPCCVLYVFGQESWFLGCFALYCLLGWCQSACSYPWFLSGVEELLSRLTFRDINTIQVVLAAQLFCGTGQFLGHGIFEKRAPALLDNLVQALLMGPFFVLLEVLQIVFEYEPYPGFRASVQSKIAAEIKEWQEKKQKKIS
ncbi:hypothetical protein ACOSQ3_024250 [Xanthoceras sorbifolium]